jgi:hypothetical protein
MPECVILEKSTLSRARSQPNGAGTRALDLRDGFCGELRAAAARDEAHLAFRVRARRNGAVGGLGRVDNPFRDVLTIYSSELIFYSREHNICSDELTFCSGELIFYSLDLTFYSLELTFCSLELTFCSLELTFYSLELIFCSLELIFYSLELIFCSLELIFCGNEHLSSRAAVFCLGPAGGFWRAAQSKAGRNPPATRQLCPAPGAGHESGRDWLPKAAERGLEAFLRVNALNEHKQTLISCL